MDHGSELERRPQSHRRCHDGAVLKPLEVLLGKPGVNDLGFAIKEIRKEGKEEKRREENALSKQTNNQKRREEKRRVFFCKRSEKRYELCS